MLIWWRKRRVLSVLTALYATALSGAMVAGAVDKSSPGDHGHAPKAVNTSSHRAPSKLQSIAQKGTAAKSKGMYRDAERYLKEAVDFGRAEGVPKQELLVPLNDLADTYYRLNKLTEAEATYKDLLKRLEELNRTSSFGYATVLQNLAQVYQAAGNLPQSEKMQKDAIAIFSKSTEVRAKDEKAIAIANLAQTYVEQKKYTEAERSFKQALDMLEASAPESPQIAILYDNYAGLYRKQEKPKEALVLQEKALKLLERGLGKAHPEVAIALVNISQTYIVLDRKPEAEQALQRCLEINERVFGAASEQTADTLHKLIKFYKVSGRAAEAKHYEARLLQSSTPAKNGSTAAPHKP